MRLSRIRVLVGALLLVGSIGCSPRTRSTLEAEPVYTPFAGRGLRDGGIPPGTVPLAAVILGGHSLIADARGPYRDKWDGVNAFAAGSASIVTWAGLWLHNNQPRPDTGARAVPRLRYMEFDLSKPVVGTGARPLGRVRDSLARVHVFYRELPEKRSYIDIVKMPVGETRLTDRVEIWIRTGDDQYVLQFGPWGMGKFSPRGEVGGEGTTPATISRPSATRWDVRSAAKSIGRLWNVNDVTNPQDRGLYEFSFALRIDITGEPESPPAPER